MGTVEFPRVVDRNVATPSLVKLTNVESNIYNVEPETGTVVEEGTPLDSALFTGVKNYIDSETEDAIKFASKEDSLIHLENYNHISTLGIGTQGKTSVNLMTHFHKSYQHGLQFNDNFDGSLTITGTPEIAWVAVECKDIIVKPNTKYTVSLRGGVGQSTADIGSVFIALRIYAKSGERLANYDVFNGKSVTFTAPENASYAKVAALVGTDTTTERNTTLYPMLVEGNTPQPWTPSGITSVNELAYQVRGKNLISYKHISDKTAYGSIEIGDNYIRLYGSKVGDDAYTTSPIGANEIIPYFYNQRIDVSNFENVYFNVDATSGVKTSIYYGLWDKDNRRITFKGMIDILQFDVQIPRNAKYITIRLGIAANSEVRDCTFSNMQLELGSVATPYEPYKGTTIPIDLQGHEVCSLPDGTADEVQVTTEGTRIEKKTLKKIYNSAEGWQRINAGTYNYFVTLPTGESTNFNYIAYCDKYPVSGWVPGEFPNKKCYPNVDGTLIVRDDDYPTLNSWGAELAANPMTIVLRNERTETIPLPSVDLPALPAPTANVWSETNLPENPITKLDCIYAKNVDVYDFVNSITDEKPHIIGEGVSNGWYWRKWSDGIGECIIDYNSEKIPITGEYGALYKSNQVYLPNYPISFISYPKTLITVHRVKPDLANTVGAIIQQSDDSKTRPPSVEFLRAHKDTTSKSYGVTCVSIGRWK